MKIVAQLIAENDFKTLSPDGQYILGSNDNN